MAEQLDEDRGLDKLTNIALSLATQLAAVNSSLERCPAFVLVTNTF